MMKILMVCLGNICRSPLAEGIMSAKLKDCSGFTVDSAGTGNWHSGEQPDRRSIQIAKQYGLDISGQRARQFTVNDFEKFDLIFAMDQEIFKSLEKMAVEPSHRKKLHQFMEFAGHSQPYVPDPYYEDLKAFDRVYQLLDDACNKAKVKILELAADNKP